MAVYLSPVGLSAAQVPNRVSLLQLTKSACAVEFVRTQQISLKHL